MILGLDPGLASTGWGLVAMRDGRLTHIAHGEVKTKAGMALAERLYVLDKTLSDVLGQYQPKAVAIEEIFVNKNPQSTIKLAHARGVVMLCAARSGVPVHEYAPRFVKKAIVGTGRAEKRQIQAMLKVLLPRAEITGADASDALAVAITHAHMAR